jgi:hypothetical protein
LGNLARYPAVKHRWSLHGPSSPGKRAAPAPRELEPTLKFLGAGSQLRQVGRARLKELCSIDVEDSEKVSPF